MFLHCDCDAHLDHTPARLAVERRIPVLDHLPGMFGARPERHPHKGAVRSLDHSKALENLIDRLRDLMVPFQQGMYYLPEMNGSYSIKNVLPALIPALSYDDLEIGDGSSASLAFEEMMYNPDADIPGIRKNLLGYCGLDTLAMVRILQQIKSKSSSNH